MNEQSITGFEIAGEDQRFYPAFATVDAKHNRVKVWSEQIKTPKGGKKKIEFVLGWGRFILFIT
jgi:hypothetical protein